MEDENEFKEPITGYLPSKSRIVVHESKDAMKDAQLRKMAGLTHEQLMRNLSILQKESAKFSISKKIKGEKGNRITIKYPKN